MRPPRRPQITIPTAMTTTYSTIDAAIHGAVQGVAGRDGQEQAGDRRDAAPERDHQAAVEARPRS